MKTLAFIFSYNRPEVLRACIASVCTGSDFVPDEIKVIDDGSTDIGNRAVIEVAANQFRIIPWWNRNRGFSHSASEALHYAPCRQPDYLFLIEGDYVFRPHGLDIVMDVFENTEQGRNCAGIVGYDHPNFRNAYHTDYGFSACMQAQVGEDNVNRAVLHKPQIHTGGKYQYAIEMVSNTCFTCYLNWRRIQEIAAEFPELNDLLDQACAPRDNPNYPDSGKYKRERTVDDGMLSHAISLCWNRWAIKHGIDREKNAAWLNIRPSVAEHRFQGGTHF